MPNISMSYLEITTTINQSVTVVNRGKVTSSTWSWVPGEQVFVGPNGVLTQTYDSNWAFVVVVGVAIDSTTINVYLRTPIL